MLTDPDASSRWNRDDQPFPSTEKISSVPPVCKQNRTIDDICSVSPVPHLPLRKTHIYTLPPRAERHQHSNRSPLSSPHKFHPPCYTIRQPVSGDFEGDKGRLTWTGLLANPTSVYASLIFPASQICISHLPVLLDFV